MMKIIFLYLIFAISFDHPYVYSQEVKLPDQTNAVADSKKIVNQDEDTQFIDEFLKDTKNPFQSILPEPKVVVKPPPVVVPKPQERKPVDPNKVPDSVLQISEKMKINGLVWNTEEPQAIINGQLVSEGETLLGAKVLKITQKGVQIKYNGYSIFIKNKIE